RRSGRRPATRSERSPTCSNAIACSPTRSRTRPPRPASRSYPSTGRARRTSWPTSWRHDWDCAGLRRRNDDLDEPGLRVVDQARDDEAAGQGSPGELAVDADGGPRVVDLLGPEVRDRDLEELGERLGERGEPLDAAVGVVEDRQLRRAGLRRTARA